MIILLKYAYLRLKMELLLYEIFEKYCKRPLLKYVSKLT